MQVGFVTRRRLQNGRFDLGKALGFKPGSNAARDRPASCEKRPAVGMPGLRPEPRERVIRGHQFRPVKRWH